MKSGRPPYAIAIPSHRRAETCRDVALAYLKRTDVDQSRVHLFLSDDADAVSYRAAGWDGNTVVCREAKNGRDKFNAIHRHFEPGTPVFVMEDDVTLVEALATNANEKRELARLHDHISLGFQALGGGPGIWGVAPHDNAFFMSGKVTRSLKLVVAFAFGFVSTRDATLECRQVVKHDYERTLRYFRKYGQTVRLDMVGAKTASYTTPGGMQADHSREDRAKLEAAACAALLAEFPRMLRPNPKRTSPFPELTFLRIREQVAAW